MTGFGSDLLFGALISIDGLLHRLTSPVLPDLGETAGRFLEAEAWDALYVQVELLFCSIWLWKVSTFGFSPVCMFSSSTLQPVWTVETDLVSIPVTNYENKPFILVYSQKNLLECIWMYLLDVLYKLVYF